MGDDDPSYTDAMAGNTEFWNHPDVEAVQKTYREAAEAYARQVERFIDIEVRKHFPTATELRVNGEYTYDSGFIVRVQQVRAGDTVLAGWDDEAPEDAEALFEQLSEEIDPLLDLLGELTSSDYEGYDKTYTLNEPQ